MNGPAAHFCAIAILTFKDSITSIVAMICSIRYTRLRSVRMSPLSLVALQKRGVPGSVPLASLTNGAVPVEGSMNARRGKSSMTVIAMPPSEVSSTVNAAVDILRADADRDDAYFVISRCFCACKQGSYPRSGDFRSH